MHHYAGGLSALLGLLDRQGCQVDTSQCVTLGAFEQSALITSN